MSFPKYPKYKDSGIEWLGEVPEHWQLDRMKWSTQSCKNGIWGDEANQDENDIPCVRVADFDRQRLRVELDEPTMRNVTVSERVGRVLRQGDLLLEKSGGGEGQPVGCVVLYDDRKEAVCSNFVAKVEVASGMNSSFWRYLHAAAYSVRLNTRSIKQTSGIQNLDQQQYLDEIASFPPEIEQTLIASFLDRETSKIDALVGEQRRLIELLKEKRQAVISHAVTKGLNPNAPLKPSGIEWLGDVPDHWDAEMLLRVTSKIGNGFVGPTRDILVENGVPYVQATHIKRGRINFDGAYFVTPEWAEWQSKAALQLDDVLIVQTGAGTGDIGLVSEDEVGYRCHALIIVRSDTSRLLGSFLSLALQSHYGRQNLESIQTGGMHPHLNCGNVKFVFVPLPPTKEQTDIVNYVTEEAAKFDTLEAEAERAIELLQERRTALISAAVTGKIDVREFVESEAT